MNICISFIYLGVGGVGGWGLGDGFPCIIALMMMINYLSWKVNGDNFPQSIEQKNIRYTIINIIEGFQVLKGFIVITDCIQHNKFYIHKTLVKKKRFFVSQGRDVKQRVMIQYSLFHYPHSKKQNNWYCTFCVAICCDSFRNLRSGL